MPVTNREYNENVCVCVWPEHNTIATFADKMVMQSSLYGEHMKKIEDRVTEWHTISLYMWFG